MDPVDGGIFAITEDHAALMPTADRMLAWLLDGNAVTGGGAVYNWVNPKHPGSPYMEAAAWLLEFLARRVPSARDLREGIARRLAADIEACGAAGRQGIRYVFDSGIVLEALLAHRVAGGQGPKSTVISSLQCFISRALQRRMATDPASHSSHWSLSYGCHLLRLLPVLLRHPNQQTGKDLVAQLLEDFVPVLDKGRFPTAGKSSLTYTHAHCYAAEGLLGLYRMTAHDGLNLPIPRQRVGSIVRECAQWLRQIQQLDGGIPAAFDENRALGEARGDSTAQAIRLWVATDKPQFATAISAGLDFLARLMQPCGGLAYSPEVEDINTWVTVFAADAMMAVESET